MPKKTEAQTRQQIIDQRLKKAGWDVNDPSQVTSELDIWVGLPEGVTEAEHAAKAFSGVKISDWLPRLDQIRTLMMAVLG